MIGIQKLAFATACLSLLAPAMTPALSAQVGETPTLTSPRITQDQISSHRLSLTKIRTHGLRVFASPFNKLDGYGDGAMNFSDPISPGGRPTLQNNGTFLRVNGLDSQSCMECHSLLSTATVPFRFGVGGVGGANNNVVFQPRVIDVAGERGQPFAFFNGRFINPPFLLGAGGVELVAKEMTRDLQALKARAQNNPGMKIPLVTKGVRFGTIRYAGGHFDTGEVEGIDDDLVVRPFGRKGEFATTRAFDVDALRFHMGMEPVENVGQGIDQDRDGVIDEVLVGEVSALAIFTTTLETPEVRGQSPTSQRGRGVFDSIGCTSCHTPFLDTVGRDLTYSFPEVPTDPTQNVYYSVALDRKPMDFPRVPRGGVRVPMFSDLKRHDLGPGLAESFGHKLDRHFVTARLWGIADTAPYLHDGRALTLTDAILLHGGEAQGARDAFARLSDADKKLLLAFLRTLRTPTRTAEGLDVSRL